MCAARGPRATAAGGAGALSWSRPGGESPVELYL